MSDKKTVNSYAAKHKMMYSNKSKLRNTHEQQLSKSKEKQEQLSMIQSEVLGRQSQIRDSFLKSEEASIIKIEETLNQEQNLYEEYKDMEAQYNKQLDNTRRQIEKIRQSSQNERIKIKEMEKGLSEKRKRQAQFKEILDNATRASLATEAEDYSEKISNLQKQLQKLIGKNNIQIASLEIDKQQLLSENKELDQKIHLAQEQLQSLSEFETQKYHQNLTFLLNQQSLLKSQIDKMQKSNKELEIKISNIEMNRPLSEQTQRKYLQIYEKLFIIGEIQKVQQLLAIKEQQISKLEEYEKRKNKIKQKKSQIQAKQRRLKEKEKLIEALTRQIKEKSTILLNLYSEGVR